MKLPAIKSLGELGLLLCWELSPSPELLGYLKGLTELLRKEYRCEVIHTYNEIFIKINPDVVVIESLREILNTFKPVFKKEVRCLHLPVCYEAEFAWDMEFLCTEKKLTVNEVIDLHSDTNYTLYFIGFLPGFPYLDGLSKRLYTPRRGSPRLNIAAGSVGIGGEQTGIYPQESPGGWHIIGRTPLKLFNLRKELLSPLENIDVVKFEPITSLEYHQILKAEENEEYQPLISLFNE